MAAKIAPPKLKNDTSYSEWKNKLDMWCIVCGYEKKEQAIIVLLQSLNENKKAEKAVSKLKVTDLNVDDGFDKLINKLDKTFKLRKPKSRIMYMLNLTSFFELKIWTLMIIFWNSNIWTIKCYSLIWNYWIIFYASKADGSHFSKWFEIWKYETCFKKNFVKCAKQFEKQWNEH